MEEVITQLGIGGILVVLVLREVFSFLDKKRGNGNGKAACAVWTQVDVRQMERQLNILLELHDQRDDDGVPVWYVRKAVTQSLSHMADKFEEMARKFHEQSDSVQRQCREAQEASRRICALLEKIETSNQRLVQHLARIADNADPSTARPPRPPT